MRRAGITQKDIDNARKSQEMNIIEDCKKFRHIHNHVFWWCLVDIHLGRLELQPIMSDICQNVWQKKQDFKNFEINISGPETPVKQASRTLFSWMNFVFQFLTFFTIFRCIPQIGHSNKMSDGYEIKERTVKIWIMLIMKGQRFFISRRHTDTLSWLDIYYHKERSKLKPENWLIIVESDAVSRLIAF